MSATRKLEELNLNPPVQLTVVTDSNSSAPQESGVTHDSERSSSTNLELVTLKPNIVAGVALDSVLGKVLNLNILGNGSKICSYNCSYCQMGPTTVRLNQIKKESQLPSIDQIIEAVSQHLMKATGAESDFETICLTGNGEPTLHPDFAEIALALKNLRQREFPQKKLAIRTNASTLDSRKILDAVNLFDDRVIKLDVGNERLFKAFNRPLTRRTLSRLISDIRSLKDVLIEALFVKGSSDNTDASDVEDWMEVVAMTQPKRVHIGTISTVPHLNGLIACDEDTLYTIASRFERRTQIRAIVRS